MTFSRLTYVVDFSADDGEIIVQLNKMMSVIIADLVKAEQLTLVSGSDCMIKAIGKPGSPEAGDLVFVWDAGSLASWKKKRPAALIINRKYLEHLPTDMDDVIIYSAKDARLVFAKLGSFLRPSSAAGWPGIHASAQVHPTATLSEGCQVGPGVVIGPGSKLGKNCVIFPNVVIDENVVIGDQVMIQSQSFIGSETLVGDKVVIQAGVSIGTDGFGFAMDVDHNFNQLPHLGRVVLEDDVHVGSNTCIDRAVFEETLIKKGTKLDNLCHIAHNVELGENCVLTSGFCIAGSSKVGDRVMSSGQAGVFPHIEVGSDIHLHFRAGVIDSIRGKGEWAGLPARPMKDYLKNESIARKLVPLRNKIRELDKLLKSSIKG